MRTYIIFCSMTLVWILYAGSSHAAEITGRASVIDGDTIEIHGTRIRLHGIDAPEAGQSCQLKQKSYRCGQESAFVLTDLVSNSTVTCIKKDTDRYGRMVAQCFARSVNLNEAMVKTGWALAYRDYSTDYVHDEQHAHENKLGLWAGEFQAPWEYRHGPNVIQGSERGKCLIKGNINSEGRKIYHLPGTTTYGRTRIDESQGERWFCSEADALAAGWNPPRN